MKDGWRIAGRVVPGHGVASGLGPRSPYPAGSISMQRPHFARAGLDLSSFHEGTLNVSIEPLRWRLVHAVHRFEGLRWTHLHPPETFSFAHAELAFMGRRYAGWVYYPHPEAKAAHFHDASIVELLMPWVDGLSPGGRVELELSGAECALV